MSGTERRRELRRRRHRKTKLEQLKRRAEKGTGGDKAEIANKIRKLTPGAHKIIERWDLES